MRRAQRIYVNLLWISFSVISVCVRDRLRLGRGTHSSPFDEETSGLSIFTRLNKENEAESKHISATSKKKINHSSNNKNYH